MKIDWHRHRSYIYGTWEPEVVNALSRVISEGNIALDIGSHTGFYALLLSKLVGQSGTVIAFEPLPGNFRILEENIGLNQLNSRVIAINKAVLDSSNDEVRLTVPIDESSSLNSSPWGSVFKDSGDAVIVKAVALDDFLNEIKLPVNFIKMDVEGAEDLVVLGALKTIERHHPTMLIELHHPDSRAEDHPIIPLLNGLNYEIEWLDRLHPTSHVLVRWNGSNGLK